jgi:hypothetical protein
LANFVHLLGKKFDKVEVDLLLQSDKFQLERIYSWKGFHRLYKQHLQEQFNQTVSMCFGRLDTNKQGCIDSTLAQRGVKLNYEHSQLEPVKKYNKMLTKVFKGETKISESDLRRISAQVQTSPKPKKLTSRNLNITKKRLSTTSLP